MKFDVERLYNLLPAVYRVRDAALVEDGKSPPLKALISILADELDNIEENLDQLYDDQFIETCDEWVIPYIGALVGSRPLTQVPDFKYSRRSEVANTIAYRRRKGTASIIEQLARDVTGWDSNVVEYFDLLGSTQYLNHLRPHNITMAGLRDWEKLEFANSPFDKMAKTVDVRNIYNRRGKYNIPNIGVFLWRTSSNSMSNSNAFQIDSVRYTFHQLGIDIPLYNEPVAEDKITHLAQPANVALPISRRQLYEDLKSYLNQGPEDDYVAKYFYAVNDDSSLNKIFLKVMDHVITPDELRICNLSDDDSGNWINLPKASEKVIIDPELGRIAFPPDFLPAQTENNVRVSFNYGFGLTIGGGSYDRQQFISGKGSISTIRVPSQFSSIQSAIDDLGNGDGIIEIEDNATYTEQISITIGNHKQLILRAKDGCRPALRLIGDMRISGGANSVVEINGLLIDGGNLEVENGSQLQELKIIHTTIKPEASGNQIRILPVTTQLTIDRSIVSGIRIADGANAIIKDSIVDVIRQIETSYDGINGAMGGTLKIENCSIIGRVNAKMIELASNCIFTSYIRVAQVQKGCMRFSYFPQDSITPRAYKCQPSLSGRQEMKPTFTSMQFGHPQYLQLNYSTPLEISNGADNGSEMGVYYQQFTPQKIANLRIRLDEYLRFGLEAGIFLAS